MSLEEKKAYKWKYCEAYLQRCWRNL